MSYIFKIKLRGLTKPSVCRRVSVPDNFTFAEFHLIIQAAFGWGNCHLYEFVDSLFRPKCRIAESSHFEFCDEDDVQNADETIISGYFKSVGDKCVYTYDFGDGWEHDVVLEGVENDGKSDPECISGKGLCPPENCGGIYGYERLKELAKVDYISPEDEELFEWYGFDYDCFDPEYFDLDEAKFAVSNWDMMDYHSQSDDEDAGEDNIQKLVDNAAEILMSGSVCYVDYQNNICQTNKFKNMGPYCVRLNPPTKKQYIAFLKTVIQCIPKKESKLRASLSLALNSQNPYESFDEILSVTPYATDWNADKYQFHAERVSSKALEVISKSFSLFQ